MYHYLFTNDLRIANLDSSLQRAGTCFINNTVPSSTEDKSENNNIKTLSFYFNITENSNCAKLAAEGNIRSVVLNFIKKFQFPNPRTRDSLNDCIEDEITLAPMRLVVQFLYMTSIQYPENAYLNRNEILDFFFYNSAVAKTNTPNIMALIDSIIKYRKTGVLPPQIEQDEEKRFWKQEGRQIREMIKVLTWSGCVSENENQEIFIHQDNLSNDDKAFLFDIITYTGFWTSPADLQYEKIKENYQEYMDIDDDEISLAEEISAAENTGAVKKGQNLLLYGVPGCGKSYYIDHDICGNVSEDYKERVVFYPDYTYSDFVGQIMPQNNSGVITYPFVPGPFTRILEKAKNNTENHYYLIIEEINRGNAPAIFGDIFQVLDRDEETGISKYSITNADIAEKVFGDRNKKVFIPSNLSILATMNTADQNVFTLDTAFQRRWKMRSIPNDIASCKHANQTICATNVTWKSFAETINDKIIDFNKENLSSEDRRLGAYFVKEDELDSDEIFAEKVLMYLWNDAFKYNRDDVFKSEYRTLEELIDGFKTVKFDIFTDKLKFDNDVNIVLTDDFETDTAFQFNSLPASDYIEGKNDYLINLYNILIDMVKDNIEGLDTYTTASKRYIGLSCEGISKRNFTDVVFRKNSIVVSTEQPMDDVLVSKGRSLANDGHHNHYFEYEIANDQMLDEALAIIMDSYKQLKLG